MAEQWSVVVIVEGDINPFDITSDYLEALRVRGNYDIVATSISPISGVRKINHDDKCGDNDNYDAADDNHIRGNAYDNDICSCGHYHDYRTYGDILAAIDGHDTDTYAGRNPG